MSRHPVTVTEDGVIQIPHIGITLRVLLDAAASSAQPDRRRYRIQLKGSTIGEVRVRRTPKTEDENKVCSSGLGNSPDTGSPDPKGDVPAVCHLEDACRAG